MVPSSDRARGRCYNYAKLQKVSFYDTKSKRKEICFRHDFSEKFTTMLEEL